MVWVLTRNKQVKSESRYRLCIVVISLMTQMSLFYVYMSHSSLTKNFSQKYREEKLFKIAYIKM